MPNTEDVLSNASFTETPSMSMLSVAVHAPAPRSTAAATTVLSNIDAYDGFILCCNNNGQPLLPVPRTPHDSNL